MEIFPVESRTIKQLLLSEILICSFILSLLFRLNFIDRSSMFAKIIDSFFKANAMWRLSFAKEIVCLAHSRPKTTVASEVVNRDMSLRRLNLNKGLVQDSPAIPAREIQVRVSCQRPVCSMSLFEKKSFFVKEYYCLLTTGGLLRVSKIIILL